MVIELSSGKGICDQSLTFFLELVLVDVDALCYFLLSSPCLFALVDMTPWLKLPISTPLVFLGSYDPLAKESLLYFVPTSIIYILVRPLLELVCTTRDMCVLT